MQLWHWNSKADGELTEGRMRARLEAMGYAVTRYTYPPGTYFAPHMHAADKIDGVLSGRFRMCMGGRSIVLEAGDMLAVPGGALHSAGVVGNAPVISLDAVRYR